MAEIAVGVLVGLWAVPYIYVKVVDSIMIHSTKKRIKKLIMKKTYISNSEDICVICQEDYKREKKCAKLNCNHEFHKKCIMRWICQKPTCPLCNEGLMKQNGERYKLISENVWA